MIWLIPIVALLLIVYGARQTLSAQTNRSNTVIKSADQPQHKPADQENTTSTAAANSDTHSATDSSQATAQPRPQPPLPKNDVKPHEAPSLLFASNAAAEATSEGKNQDKNQDPNEDEWDEVADIGDITMDISEMLKELNLRETDSPRLDIDTNEYSQLKSGQPGDVQPEKIVNVAGKLKKMLH